MNRTYDLEEVYKSMACYSLMEVEFKERCRLAAVVEDCHYIINFIHYFKMMYCNLQIKHKDDELAFIVVLILIVIFVMVLLAHGMEKYFGPILKILSSKLKMNEYLAGITLLSFGNAMPEVMGNFMPVRGHAPIFTVTMSNALCVLLVSGGTVCYVRPFKLNGTCTIRDLLFLLLSTEVLIYVITTDGKTTQAEALVLILIYIVFLAINIIHLIFVRVTIKSLKIKIKKLKNEPATLDHTLRVQELEIRLEELEQDSKMVIHNYAHSTRYGSSNRSRYSIARSTHSIKAKSTYSSRSRSKTGSRRSDSPPPALDENITRNILHNRHNSKNRFLYAEFFESLIPINIEDWKLSGWIGRIYTILTTPIVICCAIFIPLVDYHQNKHGWSKLLNCTQIITNPYWLLTFVHAMIVKQYNDWFIILDLRVALWSLFFTVPLSLYVFFNTRTDKPPQYHLLFIILTASSSLLIMAFCAAELEVLCVIIGLCLHMTEDFVACTVRSFATAIGDVIINIELAMQGYEKMAFASVLAGPIFSLTAGIGVPFFFNSNVGKKESVYWLFGVHGINCYLFFSLTVILTMWWTSTFNFFTRRSAAIFSFTMYILYLTYATLVETKCIHPFSRDQIFHPA